jgi:hypothetical protein
MKRSDLSKEDQERLRAKDREYHQTRKHRPNYIEGQKKTYLKHRETFLQRARVHNLKKKYGLSYEEFQSMYETRKGLCDICKGPSEEGRLLSVDHCHETGKVRGLLCGPCNRGLGLFKDDPNLLHKALEYVS